MHMNKRFPDIFGNFKVARKQGNVRTFQTYQNNGPMKFMPEVVKEMHGFRKGSPA